MSKYFPQPYELFAEDISVKLDLSNYLTKANLIFCLVLFSMKIKLS